MPKCQKCKHELKLGQSVMVVQDGLQHTDSTTCRENLQADAEAQAEPVSFAVLKEAQRLFHVVYPLGTPSVPVWANSKAQPHWFRLAQLLLQEKAQLLAAPRAVDHSEPCPRCQAVRQKMEQISQQERAAGRERLFQKVEPELMVQFLDDLYLVLKQAYTELATRAQYQAAQDAKVTALLADNKKLRQQVQVVEELGKYPRSLAEANAHHAIRLAWDQAGAESQTPAGLAPSLQEQWKQLKAEVQQLQKQLQGYQDDRG